jgi:hypothetical protein
MAKSYSINIQEKENPHEQGNTGYRGRCNSNVMGKGQQ